MRNPINALIISVAIAIFLIGGSSVYSAWVSASNHHSACNRSDGVLDATEQVIALLLTPQPGQTYTAAQFDRVTRFEKQSSAILDAKRC